MALFPLRLKELLFLDRLFSFLPMASAQNLPAIPQYVAKGPIESKDLMNSCTYHLQEYQPVPRTSAINNPWALAIFSSGKIAAILDDAFNIIVYSIDPASKQFMQIQMLNGNGTMLRGALSLEFSPCGKIAASAKGINMGQANNSVTIYSIDNSTGLFTPVQTIATKGPASAVAFSPSGTIAAVVLTDVILIYNVDNAQGRFTSILQTIVSQGAYFITFSPKGELAAASNGLIFRVDSSSGKFTQIQTIEGVISKWSFSPSLNRAANIGDGFLKIFSIDESSGQFTLVQTVNAGYGLSRIALHPHIGVAASSSTNNISVFNIDNAGNFSPLQAFNPSDGICPLAMAFSPDFTTLSMTMLKGNAFLINYDVLCGAEYK